jgi:hypothetical protein
MARRHRDGREEWLGVWLNELHGDYLAYDRLAERRTQAARAALVAERRRTRRDGRLRWLAGGVARAVRLLF